MRQILLFIFLVLLIFNGRTQSSSLDSLRLVLPIGHTDGVWSVVFSHDDKLLMTSSSDKTARIYEVVSGREVQVLKGNSSNINSSIFLHSLAIKNN